MNRQGAGGLLRAAAPTAAALHQMPGYYNPHCAPRSDMEPVREGSWSGSEEERSNEPGLCLPPARGPNTASRFKLPAGTVCLVSRLSPLRWKTHRTTRELAFERYESAGGGLVTFREQGYLIRVAWSAVKRWT